MNYEPLINCAGVTQTGRVIHMDWSRVRVPSPALITTTLKVS
jgi:hypothetical protein